MSADLYETLGVERDASHVEIKRAYRRKAKSVHPDAGGSPSDFAAVARAHAILIRPEKREEYDRTGKVDDDPNGPRHAAMAIIGEMMGQIVEQIGDSPIAFDLVAKMRDAMDERIEDVTCQRNHAKAKAARLERVAARFKAGRGKDNILREMILAKVRMGRATIVSADNAIATIELARTLLEGLSFDAEEAPVARRGWSHTSHASFTSASSGG